MKKFTEEELKKFDGKNKPAYIAYKGKVYDISDSYHWQEKKHHARHKAGKSLTGELKHAPHGEDLIKKFPIVGELITPE
ncbi:MAG: cytochrome b5 domain-containing protein [bacterium]